MLIHFTEIHRSSLRKIEWILNRPVTKFYNSDDGNATTAEKRGQFPFKWQIIFCMKQVADGDKI